MAPSVIVVADIERKLPGTDTVYVKSKKDLLRAMIRSLVGLSLPR